MTLTVVSDKLRDLKLNMYDEPDLHLSCNCNELFILYSKPHHALVGVE